MSESIRLYPDTLAELARLFELSERKVSMRDLADKYLRIGLQMPLIDRAALEIIDQLLTKATTNHSIQKLTRLKKQLMSIKTHAELARRQMRVLPGEYDTAENLLHKEILNVQASTI